jgi:hypothetical protein
MYKYITTTAALAFVVLSLTACGDKEKNTTVTRYASDKCSLDSIGGKNDLITYGKAGSTLMAGWAYDTTTKASPKELQLRLAGATGSPETIKVTELLDRPDVVKAFNNSEILKSGFSLNADLSALKPGAYVITIEIPHGGSMLVCNTQKTLVIE